MYIYQFIGAYIFLSPVIVDDMGYINVISPSFIISHPEDDRIPRSRSHGRHPTLTLDLLVLLPFIQPSHAAAVRPLACRDMVGPRTDVACRR